MQEEIDLDRAEESKERAEKRLKQKDNIDVLKSRKIISKSYCKNKISQG